MYTALQIVRCDQSSATGFAPAALLLGRPLVYPLEIDPNNIDLSGTEFTSSLVVKLKKIHEDNFKIAHNNIGKKQKRYRKKYDKRNNAKEFLLKVGDRVQYKRHKSKRAYGKMIAPWVPVEGYYLILSVIKDRKTVVLQTAQGKVLKKRQPFDRIRKYRGT